MKKVDELLSPIKVSISLKDAAKILAAIIFIIVIGIYIGNILFGKDSVEVLIELQNKEDILKREVQRLKEENAKLQKEYFELKELEPD